MGQPVLYSSLASSLVEVETKTFFLPEKMIGATTSDYRRMKKKSSPQMREIEVLIISAQDLKDVKHVFKMRVYAIVYIEKDVHVAKTRVDEKGGVNPTWNEVVKVKFHEDLVEKNDMAALNIDIYAHGHVREKVVGSARVLLCDVLKGGDAAEPSDNPIQCLTVQVWRDGIPQGLLNIWVPPTGKFLIRRESLSFSVRDREGEEEEEVVVDEEVKKEEEEVLVAVVEGMKRAAAGTEGEKGISG